MQGHADVISRVEVFEKRCNGSLKRYTPSKEGSMKTVADNEKNNIDDKMWSWRTPLPDIMHRLMLLWQELLRNAAPAQSIHIHFLFTWTLQQSDLNCIDVFRAGLSRKWKQALIKWLSNLSRCQRLSYFTQLKSNWPETLRRNVPPRSCFPSHIRGKCNQSSSRHSDQI